MNTNAPFKIWQSYPSGFTPAAEGPTSGDPNGHSSLRSTDSTSNGIHYQVPNGQQYPGAQFQGQPAYASQYPHPYFVPTAQYSGPHPFPATPGFPVGAAFPENPQFPAVHAAIQAPTSINPPVPASIHTPTVPAPLPTPGPVQEPNAISGETNAAVSSPPEQSQEMTSEHGSGRAPSQESSLRISQKKVHQSTPQSLSQSSQKSSSQFSSDLPKLVPLRQAIAPEKAIPSSDDNEATREQNSISKRNHKRTYQSLVGVLKLPPLKKRDGDALWRRDLQYDLLHAIFSDRTPAFFNSNSHEKNCTFADIYIDAMANSSKCSKLLSDKLTSNRSRAIKIAMVCLLVNCGRMNTTLNFFPEMKTQLRTYHPIPSLQTNDDQDYKQLQDAPRLKSILKGACDSKNEPNSFKALEEVTQIPRTNAINLIFLMSTFSSEVEERLFPASANMLYFHIFMDHTKSSKSRARTFLWLMWAYLEAPKIGDNMLNPFGSTFPTPVTISNNMVARENVDTPAELAFGNKMTLERIAIMNLPAGPPGGQAPRTPLELPEPPSRPLITYKFKLRTAREQRVHKEFHNIIRSKRKVFKEKRQKRHNELKDLWYRFKDLDHLYDSDEDIALAQANVSGIPDGVLSTGLTTKNGDYGERFLSQAVALKRVANKISK